MIKQELRVEKVFCLIILAIGILTVFILPPFAAPDEPNHFLRIYDITFNHKFVSQDKSFLPIEVTTIDYSRTSGLAKQSIQDGTFKQHLINPLSLTNSDAAKVFINTTLYSPINYLPQTIGFTLAKLFYPSMYAYIYLGRLASLFFFTLLIYFAIKITPFGKWFMAYFALFPTLVQEACSLATDSLNTGICFITIALALKLAFFEETIKVRHIIGIIILAIIIGFLKPVSVIVVATFFLVPKSKFGHYGSIKKWLLSIIIFALTIISYLIWHYHIQKYHLENIYLHDTHIAFHTYLSSKEALLSIINNPLNFLHEFFETIKNQGVFFLVSLYGSFGSFVVSLPKLAVILGYCGIILVTFLGYNKNQIAINIYQRIFCLGLFFAYLSLVLLILYIAWTPVAGKEIKGIQGRYFAGALPFLGVVFANSWFYNRYEKMLANIIVGIMVFNLLYMLKLILKFYYNI